MKLFRKIIFWLHLCCGVSAGAVVLLMSVTGVLLTYEVQLQQWEAGGAVSVPTSPSAAPMPLEALVLAAARAHADPPSTITVSSDPAQAVVVGWGRDGQITINPYTGENLPESPTTVRDALVKIRSWHRWIGQDGEYRELGKKIADVCNLVFLFIVVSGPYLWWPRKWTRGNLKAVTLFRGGLAGKARDFNWHNVIGVWSMIPLFFIVLGGAVISYPWASDLVYRAFGDEPPGPAAGGGPPKAETQSLPPTLEALHLADYVERATEETPAWRTIRINLPRSVEDPVVLAIDAGSGRQPQWQSTMMFDRETATVLKVDRFGDQTAGAKARRILRFAHTGEVGGVFGQTLAGLVSAGAVVLAYTGIALSWRRFRAWRVRRAAAA